MEELGNPTPTAGLAVKGEDAVLDDGLSQDSSRTALLLSNLLSPPVVAFGTFWVLANEFAVANRWQVFLICVLAQAVLPILYLKWAVRRRLIGDVDMSVRAERRQGLPILGVIYLAGCVAAFAAGVPGGPLVVTIGSLIVLTTIWLVNLVYKASGHVAGVTAYMTAISLLVQPLHAGLLIIPALAWARVRSGAHTFAQTIWGFSLGAFSTWLIYAYLYVPYLSRR